MYEATFSDWMDDIESNLKTFRRITSQIENGTRRLKTNRMDGQYFNTMMLNIKKALNFWTGNTYIGYEKSEDCKKTFQSFFIALYQLFITCRNSNNDFLKDLGTKALFQGTVYRYLGYGSTIGDINKPKEVEYNNIYVSWSKNKRNEYIESKLYGIITLITCEISNGYYGIDLEELGVSRGDEREVVFPTYENLVIKIKNFKV